MGGQAPKKIVLERSNILVGVTNSYRMNKIPPESTLLGSRFQEVLDEDLKNVIQEGRPSFKNINH